ncbi:MAG TPA: DtxR family transcriptional regulator [Armatimonadetes bacterium]|nr:DtxR family transcriptional regulator [Armatimonadota bacterium]
MSPFPSEGEVEPVKRQQADFLPEREEVLECIWMLEEEGQANPTLEELKACILSLPCEVEELPRALEVLEGEGLIKREGGRVTFTEEGRAKAREVIRRHRLAERLLNDLLEMPSGSMEAGACRLEHALDPEVTDAVCTFLGHPKTCPHGKPIPPGPCCERFDREVRPITLPLSELQPGNRGRVVFITPSIHARLDRLASLGLVPGAVVRLHQKRPSVVVDVGETQLAIDQEIAKEIYVRPMKSEEGIRLGGGKLRARR